MLLSITMIMNNEHRQTQGCFHRIYKVTQKNLNFTSQAKPQSRETKKKECSYSNPYMGNLKTSNPCDPIQFPCASIFDVPGIKLIDPFSSSIIHNCSAEKQFQLRTPGGGEWWWRCTEESILHYHHCRLALFYDYWKTSRYLCVAVWCGSGAFGMELKRKLEIQKAIEKEPEPSASFMSYRGN